MRGWEGGSKGREICILMIHFVVQQKPTQHCKAIILQLKINFKNAYPFCLGISLLANIYKDVYNLVCYSIVCNNKSLEANVHH